MFSPPCTHIHLKWTSCVIYIPVLYMYLGSPLILLLLSCKVMDHFNSLRQLDNKIKKMKKQNKKTHYSRHMWLYNFMGLQADTSLFYDVRDQKDLKKLFTESATVNTVKPSCISNPLSFHYQNKWYACLFSVKCCCGKWKRTS